MAIFKDDDDRTLFMQAMGEVCERTGWRIHAYVLMGTHFHCLLETPQANLVAGMKWLLGAYTQRCNARWKQRGHLFQGRYKALPVDSENDGYFETVSTYIHLNPARAGAVAHGQSLKKWKWSSFPVYLTQRRKRPAWLETERVLGDFGVRDGYAGRREYESYIVGRARDLRKNRKENEEEWRAIRRGWCLGGEEFRESLLDRLEGVLGEGERSSFSGPEIKEHGEKKAQRLIKCAFDVMGLTEEDLVELPKGAEQKCVAAWLAHTRTTAQHRWLSEKLKMGNPSNMTVHIKHIAHATDRSLLKLKRRVTAAVDAAEKRQIQKKED
jgi:REP element-mobilizing transposase RayT